MKKKKRYHIFLLGMAVFKDSPSWSLIRKEGPCLNCYCSHNYLSVPHQTGVQYETRKCVRQRYGMTCSKYSCLLKAAGNLSWEERNHLQLSLVPTLTCVQKSDGILLQGWSQFGPETIFFGELYSAACSSFHPSNQFVSPEDFSDQHAIRHHVPVARSNCMMRPIVLMDLNAKPDTIKELSYLGRTGIS